MTKSQELGNLPPDNQWIQAEIARLNKEEYCAVRTHRRFT